MNTGTDNYLYLKKGEPRLGNLNDFLREKGNENSSDTAQIYLNDGGTMDVPLNEYGVYSARMAVNGGTYFAFR